MKLTKKWFREQFGYADDDGYYSFNEDDLEKLKNFVND